MLIKFARLSFRVIIAAALLWAVISIPLPFRDEQAILLLRVPIAVFIFIVYLGKTLYDTFFYPRKP